MVGAGAIGCELLKNLSMLDIGTAELGEIIVTDRYFLRPRRYRGQQPKQAVLVQRETSEKAKVNDRMRSSSADEPQTER